MTVNYSKLSAIGILLLLILCTWVVLAEPYIDLWQDRFAQAERLQRKQDALRQLIGQREHFEQHHRALVDSSALQAVFLDDKAGALADARLQRLVGDIVTRTGGRVLQAVIARNRVTQASKDSAETGDDKTVTIKVMMQGSIESIYTMLHELENSRPLIMVSNFEVSHIKSRYPVSQTASDNSYKAQYDATAFIL